MAEQPKGAMTVQKKLKMTVDGVQKSIEGYVSQGQLNLPANYSAGNALKQAQLLIQDNPKLMACTQSSLAKCMLDCVVLGLNVSKAQAYFIPYGDKAQLSVSYQGKKAIAMRIDPTIEDIVAMPLKEDEEFVFEDLSNGYVKIAKHQRNLAAMRSQSKAMTKAMESKDVKVFNDTVNDIYIGAYATILYNDGKEHKSLIMMLDRIKSSWGQSQAKPLDDNGNIKIGATHAKFVDEMICKTVITAICKPIINASDDSDLFVQVAKSVELDEAAAEAHAEKEENANTGEVIDVDFEETEVLDDFDEDIME